MKSDKVIRPGKRKQRVSTRPSRAAAANPAQPFIVPPNDGDGQGRTVSLKVSAPPSMRRAATKVRESGCFPFETENDVLRWCFYNGLQELTKMTEDMDVVGAWKTVQSWVQTSSEMITAMKWEKELTTITKNLEAMIDNGHATKAEELAEVVWKNADLLGDQYWVEIFRAKAKVILDRIRKKVKADARMNGNGHGG